MSNHREIEAQLAIYRDLTVETKADVDAHIQECSACAAKLQSYEKMEQSLKLLMANRTRTAEDQTIDLPHAIAAKQQVRHSPLSVEILRFRLSRTVQQWRPVMIGAVGLALLLLFFYTYLNHLHQQLPNVPETVQTPVSPEEEAARNGIGVTLARELVARHSNFFDNSYVDPSASSQWIDGVAFVFASPPADWRTIPITFDILAVEMLSSEYALVRLSVRYATNTVEVGRVYRHEQGTWYWTEPPAAFWGKEQTYETQHLRFEYQERDSETIAALADQLEAIYVESHQLLEVPLGEDRDPHDFFANQKLTFEIVPEHVPVYKRSGPVYRASSPALAQLSRDEATREQRFMAQLASAIVGETVQKVRNEWLQMPSGWHRVDIALKRSLLAKVLPPELLYRRDWQAKAIALTSNEYPFSLAELVSSDSSLYANLQPDSLSIADLLVEYIEAQYGFDQVLALTKYISNNTEPPDELISKLFQESLTDFESQWNQWIRQQYPSMQRIDEAFAQINLTLQQEVQAYAEDDIELYEQLLDEEASLQWILEQKSLFLANSASSAKLRTYELLSVDMQDQIARVRLRITYSDADISPQYVGRIYREIGDAWYLTAPQTFMDSDLEVYETKFFRLHYHPSEVATVVQAGPALDLAYWRLLLLLQLPETRPVKRFQYYLEDNKFNIEIKAEEVNSWSAATTSIPVASPLFYTWPQEMNESDALVYNVMTRIYGPLIGEISNSTPSNKWGMLTAGYGQWLLDESAAASPWHDTVYEQNELKRVLQQYYPIQIAELTTSDNAVDSFPINRLLLDYIVATYGEKSIAPYIRALGEYEDWDTLSRAIFNVDGATFETQWNQYIEEQYPTLVESEQR